MSTFKSSIAILPHPQDEPASRRSSKTRASAPPRSVLPWCVLRAIPNSNPVNTGRRAWPRNSKVEVPGSTCKTEDDGSLRPTRGHCSRGELPWRRK